MKRKPMLVILGLLFCGFAVFAAHSIQQEPPPTHGFSAEDLATFARSLPELPGRIVAIQFLNDSHGNVPAFIALLTQSPKNGWQILVFRSEGQSAFPLMWKSGNLDTSFAVSSSDDFKKVDLDGQSGIEFGGCAPHTCPDVFSFLLYLPAIDKAFTATYEKGNVTYSPGLDTLRNRAYKTYFDEQIKKRRLLNPVASK